MSAIHKQSLGNPSVNDERRNSVVCLVELHADINADSNASTYTSGDDLADLSIDLQVEINAGSNASTNTVIDNLADPSIDLPFNPISDIENPALTEELQPANSVVTQSGRQPNPTTLTDVLSHLQDWLKLCFIVGRCI